jgi:lipopolysaccharide transport system permease protein
MKFHSIRELLDLFRILFQYRSLLQELVRREFSGRYQGSFAGPLWPIFEPLIMFSVYVVAFGVVMKVRWGYSGDTKEYAFMMLAGLMVFNAFAECLNRSPKLISANPNFVKKIVFPLEILPWVISLNALAHMMISAGLWVLGFALLIGMPHLSVILLPFIMIAFLPMLLAVGWLFASVGVIARDLEQVASLFSRALLFISPVFYSVDAAPPAIRTGMIINPLTFIIEQMRCVLYLGKAPDIIGLLIYFVVASLASACALFIFRRLRPSFADYI